MAIFTWPFPRDPSAPPLLGIMALAVAVAASALLVAGLFNLQVNLDARQVSLEAPTVQAQNVAADRAALMALYDATGGDNWTTNTGWGTTDPLGQWHGIVTNNDGRVTEILLGGNNLTGTMPAELGNLSELEQLALWGNNLTGPIPAELGNLSNMTNLTLRDNSLSGSIPASLGGLQALRSVLIHNNSLMGPLPDELGNWNPVRVSALSFNNNQLTGQLPYGFARFTDIDFLDISNNAGLCVPLDSDFQTWFDGIATKTGDDCTRTRIWTATAAPVVGEPVIVELTAREDRLARIKATLDEYNSDPCIGYDDTRSVNSGWVWRISDTANGPWSLTRPGRHPHATFVYLPQAADVGRYLQVILVIDGTTHGTPSIGPIVAAHSVASGDQVSVAAPSGTLAADNNLSVSLPDAAAAERSDRAINPRLHSWQWEQSDDGSTGWSNVTPYHKHCESETPDSQYPLTAGDAGKHLRSYIYYNDDSSGSSVLKRAETASAGPVAP